MKKIINVPIKITAYKDRLVITIEDQGVGVPETILEGWYKNQPQPSTKKG